MKGINKNFKLEILYIFVLIFVFLIIPSIHKLNAVKCDRYIEGAINLSMIDSGSLLELYAIGTITNGECSVNCVVGSPLSGDGQMVVGDPVELLLYQFENPDWTNWPEAQENGNWALLKKDYTLGDWALESPDLEAPLSCVPEQSFYQFFVPYKYNINTKYQITSNIDISNVPYGSGHTLYFKAKYEIGREWTQGFSFTKPTPSILLTGRQAGTSNPYTAGTITIPYNTAVNLSWASSYMTGCSVSGGWSGTRLVNGTETTGNLTTSTTYVITCDPQDKGLHTGADPVTSSLVVNVGAPINSAPNSPIRVVPPIAWLNYNPNFQASITDADSDQVRAHYNITTITGDSYGGWVNSGGTSCLASNCTTGISMNDGQYSWRAYSEDEHYAVSSWTSYQWLGIDKTPPTGIITHLPTNPTTSQAVVFSVSAEDPTVNNAPSGVSSIGIYVDNILVRTCYGQTTCTYTGGPYSAGTHPYYAIVTDNAENIYSTAGAGGTFVITSAKVNYKVKIDSLAPSPNPPSNLSCEFYYCSDSKHPIIRWTYTDPASNPQAEYQVLMDNNSDFSSPEDNTGWHSQVINSGQQGAYTSSGDFAWNTIYNFKIRVKNDKLETSDWSTTATCQIPIHPYPGTDFTSSPRLPNLNENINLTDASECYDETTFGSDCSTTKGDIYQWTMTGGTPNSSVLENAITKYSTLGLKTITLRVIDSDGHTCTETKQIRVNYPLPVWREVMPF